MSDSARALLLAAPVGARLYLAREARGPGWAWRTAGPRRHKSRQREAVEGRLLRQPPGWIDDSSFAAWLPCDPCEVLRVAAELLGLELNPGQMIYQMGRLLDEATEHPDATPRGLAVACYLAAWAAQGNDLQIKLLEEADD